MPGVRPLERTNRMTTQAREVLRDCERLLAAIGPDMPGELWRPRWAGLVALLRAVGHVLEKVDAARIVNAKQVVDAAWDELRQSKPEPKIFWQFIEAERNNVPKTYAFGVGVNITVRPGTGWLSLATGESGGSPGGPTTFEAFVRSGPFEGEDPLQLCREAIQFWNGYLDCIDRQIAERGTGPAV